MNNPYPIDGREEDRIVYVRPVDKSELPPEVLAELETEDDVYAVHSADGERLALVADRDLAFVLARQNDFAPVSVH